MTTRFDKTRDILDEAITQAYEEGLLTNPELHALRGTVYDMLNDLEDEAWDEVEKDNRGKAWMKNVLTEEVEE